VEEGAIAAFLGMCLGLLLCVLLVQLLMRRVRVCAGVGNGLRTLLRSGEEGSIGLTSFMVDIAGALVSPRMSTPRFDLPRGRTMAGVQYEGTRGRRRGRSRSRGEIGERQKSCRSITCTRSKRTK
jgi:hypothetical protein